MATVARMCVLVADAMLRQAFRADAEGDPALLSETRRLLQGYAGERLA